MSDTPETDKEWRHPASFDGSERVVHISVARKLERERDEAREEWGKASMDAAQLLSEKTKVMAERDEAREDLEFRRGLYKVQESQLNDLRERLNEMQTFESTRNSQLREAIISTLEENRHLADGDDCTLAKLKSVVPDWK